ncbi:cation diffusion facilitator family transporter [Ectothiorhodospira variabilis]|uniref:cation diffusion facilitator family transporter n=1 Tax=Ectothiorhodospira variabilis TaxID=505694 RepID=UPI001EFAECD4|nr:cation diffusion facilitator family transporter [Ectothiorhodospira variabilis]MCG5497167.1 cation diffusion facilitator family transporter [Ectothiorhodospira variabilis]
MSDTHPSEERYRTTRRVTLVGAATNASLATAQVVGGFLAQSQALIADGVHTLSDLLSDFMVLFAARKANAPADDNHPYGHARIETLATVIVGLALIGVALGIALDAFRRLQSPEELLSPAPAALALAALAIISKEGLYHYTVRAARRIDSSLLHANAWHHRSDVVSSLVVLVGIGATLAGFAFMDAVAAVLVALLISLMGAKLIWNSVSELIDTGVGPEEQQQMLDSVRHLDGIHGVHELRTRRMGSALLADVHIMVGPRISVSEGHRISESVAKTLRQSRPELREVLVHVDPEDDRTHAPSSHLPCRSELMRQLNLQWQSVPGALPMENVVLHYLDGRIHLELHLSPENFETLEGARALARQLTRVTREVKGVGEVIVYFR